MFRQFTRMVPDGAPWALPDARCANADAVLDDMDPRCLPGNDRLEIARSCRVGRAVTIDPGVRSQPQREGLTAMHLADATGSPPKWHGGAACLNHDPDLFFPEGTAGPALRQVD